MAARIFIRLNFSIPLFYEFNFVYSEIMILPLVVIEIWTNQIKINKLIKKRSSKLKLK